MRMPDFAQSSIIFGPHITDEHVRHHIQHTHSLLPPIRVFVLCTPAITTGFGDQGVMSFKHQVMKNVRERAECVHRSLPCITLAYWPE